MATVDQQISAADRSISGAIDALSPDRPLLSQQILGQLRNLVEGVAARHCEGRGDAEYDYTAIKRAVDALGTAPKKLHFLRHFHKLLQESVSHYAVDGDASERLMLKYFQYLVRLRAFAQAEWNLPLLANLEKFPVSKTERHIAFTDIDISDNYSSNLTLVNASIDVLHHTMPIRLITEWAVSIRPCEFDNFARIFGVYEKVSTGQTEYSYLMDHLTEIGSTLSTSWRYPTLRTRS